MQEQQFFRTLSTMLAGFDSINIMITKQDSTLVVTFRPLPSKDIKDPAAGGVAPLSLTGTAEELDAGFFPALEKPVNSTREFFATLSDYEASVEEARKNSDMEKQKKEADRRAKETEKKERLDNDKTVREAITASETTRKTNPEAAFESLKALEKKNLLLSSEVKESLTAALNDLNTSLKQQSLF